MTEARKRLCHNIFTTALEQGINYWATITAYHWRKADDSGEVDTYNACDIDGFYADIVETEDAEEDEEGKIKGKAHRIDAAVIDRGINAVVNLTATFGGEGINPNGLLRRLCYALNGPGGNDVDFDANDADNIVQIGLFNDVVYG